MAPAVGGEGQLMRNMPSSLQQRGSLSPASFPSQQDSAPLLLPPQVFWSQPMGKKEAIQEETSVNATPRDPSPQENTSLSKSYQPQHGPSTTTVVPK